MRPFFSFYGSKWRVAKRYPSPRYRTIVEPFAGSAGYSIRYPHHDVVLVDADPIICGVWDYLIHAPSSEIAALPDVAKSVEDLQVPDEARHLIGFWLNKGASRPCKTPSAWMRDPKFSTQFWGPEIRARIASQVEHIRHWRVIHGTYSDAPDIHATWFIDPPYQVAGRHYRLHDIDYDDLGWFCVSMRGQVMVCENHGATWLPFSPFREIKTNHGKRRNGTSKEVVWRNE